jgi:16S rRNA (adenine1518-N6/adenine1519-N6)-dimethyltransferase
MTSDTPQPRQTQSYLRDLFTANHLRPKSKLGQNFLIDLNLLDFIVRHADLTRADLALEVGTGTGGLTGRLAALAGSVLSVEIDRDFHELARDAVGGIEHVHLLYADALKNKNRINPAVFTHLDELRRRYRPQRIKLVANLPFAVATPVVSNLLLSDVPFERMVVTVQWEIAEKLVAAPGGKEFGALSVMVQALADVEILRRLPPAAFWPRPAVESGIVRIWPRPAKRAQIPDLLRLRGFLRDLYSHRRKNLRGGLLSIPGGPSDKASIDAKLAALGYTGTERAETLSVAQHLELCKVFGPEGPDRPEAAALPNDDADL